MLTSCDSIEDLMPFTDYFVINFYLFEFHVYGPNIASFAKTTSLPGTRFDELYSVSADRWPLKPTARIENRSFDRMSAAFLSLVECPCWHARQLRQPAITCPSEVCARSLVANLPDFSSFRAR
jgi:hypothetical protein